MSGHRGGRQYSLSSRSSSQRGGFSGSGRGRGRGNRGRGDSSGPEQNVPMPVAAAPPTSRPAFIPVAAPSVAMSPGPSSLASTSSSLVPSDKPAAISASVSELNTNLAGRLTLEPAPMPPASSKAIRFPARPGVGKSGYKCQIRANHFLVEFAYRDLFQYDVSITPEVSSKKTNRLVIEELVVSCRASHLNNRQPAYDGRKFLYTAGALPFTSMEFVVKLTNIDASVSSSTSKRNEREFKVALKLAGKADLDHLQQFLSARQIDAPYETIQALDIVLRQMASKDNIIVGRSFFSPDMRGNLGDGVDFWWGHYQSLRPTQMGLSLNIDLSATAFYQPILVTDFLKENLKIRDLSRPLSDQDRVKVRRALKLLKVSLTCGRYPRAYKIFGISDQPLSELTFYLDEERPNMSVVQYFYEKYKTKLKFTSLPAIQAGSVSSPAFLPMEVCQIADRQRYTKKLNARQITNLLRATCRRPNQREDNIKEIAQSVKFSDALVTTEFGIHVGRELAKVEARVLRSPTLKYHDTGVQSRVDPRLGQWNMINKKMVNGGRVEFWTCVNFSEQVDRNLPFQFCRQLIEMCNSKGMEFNPNPLLPICSYKPTEIERVLVDIYNQSMEKLQNMKGKQLQLLIVILPDVTDSYGKIKRVCETELGIVSQCCQPGQAKKLSKQYFENIALKINVKAGGRNTVLDDAIEGRIPFLTDRPTIILGADVTHPQPGNDSFPSIAAVVASMDWPEATKYRGIVSAQSHREEIIQDLYKIIQDPERGRVHAGMIRELFIAFRKSTGQKPHRIIFYRDGVSEGQFNQVLLYELDAIRKACASLEEGYLPPVTFIVVQKRHHTRLFPADHTRHNLTDKSGNILPGTVVDTKICHPREFDFYLNSHAGIQGTSRPVHYHVLWDENKFTADALQVLTNNLCYTYARCTRAVSIVPPAYYAHLAAFRARYYLEETMESDSESASGGRRAITPLPSIKDNVKNVMFYC